jgi:hypothetical protein
MPERKAQRFHSKQSRKWRREFSQQQEAQRMGNLLTQGGPSNATENMILLSLEKDR